MAIGKQYGSSSLKFDFPGNVALNQLNSYNPGQKFVRIANIRRAKEEVTHEGSLEA